MTGPSRDERRAAAAAVGWLPVRAGDLAGVAWTLAADGVPASARPGVAIASGLAIWLLFRLVVRGMPPAAVFVTAGALYGYLLTLAVLQWLRNRAERTPEERRGLFRIAPQIRTTWWLGRVALRDPGADRATALAQAAALCRAVVAPGETVGATAASDRQQAELEAEGFREPRGSKGMVILTGSA